MGLLPYYSDKALNFMSRHTFHWDVYYRKMTAMTGIVLSVMDQERCTHVPIVGEYFTQNVKMRMQVTSNTHVPYVR